ncbi:MAG: hypothetical protein V1837_04020 [Candidatus Woesearchaeota archaeon]
MRTIQKLKKLFNASFDLWDSLIVIGALAILLWALLKVFGIVRSPVWVEMIPYLGGGISILGGAYKLGKIKNGVEQTEQKVDKILAMEKRFNKLEIEHNLVMAGKMRIVH